MANQQILVKGSLGILTSLLVKNGPSFIGIGFSAAQPNTDQTALGQETTSASSDGQGKNTRVAAVLTQMTTDLPNDTFQASAVITWDADAKTVNEIGLYTTDGAAEVPLPPSGGVLFACALLDPPVTLNKGDQATFNFNITYGLS